MTENVLSGAEPFFYEGNEGNEGNKIGVLVSHGFTGTTQSMRFLGKTLAEEGGFAVSGPRLKGHGTTPEDMAQSTAEDWIRSVEGAMQDLQKCCDKIFITGLSMGGTLTLYIAGMYPDLIAGAIPINGAVFLHSPDFARLAFMKDAPPMVPGVGSDIKKPGVTELAYEQMPVRAVRELYALMGATHDLLGSIACPTLVFQSKDDHVVNPQNAPFIMEHLQVEDKRLIWLEESYHVATLDNDKELIAEEALKFIQAHI